MGKKCPCEEIVLPSIPLVENCIAGTNGICFENGEPIPVINKVCREASQDADLFKWIDYAKKMCGP